MFFQLNWIGEGPGDYDFGSLAVANGEKVPLQFGSTDIIGGVMHWVEFETPYFWDGFDSIDTMKRCFETHTNSSHPRVRGNFHIRIAQWSKSSDLPLETVLHGILQDWDKELIQVIAILKRGRGKKPNPQMAEARRKLESLRDELKPTRQTTRNRR